MEFSSSHARTHAQQPNLLACFGTEASYLVSIGLFLYKKNLFFVWRQTRRKAEKKIPSLAKELAGFILSETPDPNPATADTYPLFYNSSKNTSEDYLIHQHDAQFIFEK
jgi:hypothetical protein